MIDMHSILEVLNKQMEVIKEKDRQIAKLEELLKKKVKSNSGSSGEDKKKERENTKKLLIKEVISLYKKWFKESPIKGSEKTLAEYTITDLRKVITEYKKKIRTREKKEKEALGLSKKNTKKSDREKIRKQLQNEVFKATGKKTEITSIVELRKILSSNKPKKNKKVASKNKKEEIGKRQQKKIELAKEYAKLTKKEKGWNFSEFIKNKTTAELRSLVKCQKLLNKKN